MNSRCYKSWVFEWEQLQEACRAENFCIELFLDDRTSFMFTGCEPDYLLHSADMEAKGQQ